MGRNGVVRNWGKRIGAEGKWGRRGAGPRDIHPVLLEFLAALLKRRHELSGHLGVRAGTDDAQDVGREDVAMVPQIAGDVAGKMLVHE